MTSYKHWFTLLALLGLGWAIGAWHDNESAKGQNDPVTLAIRNVIIPSQAVAHSIFKNIGDFTYGVTHAASLRRYNDQLIAKLNAANALSAKYQEIDRENQKLRELLDLDPPKGSTWINGEIIAYYHDDRTVTIRTTKGNGVKIGAPIIAPQGLFGRVIKVSGNNIQAVILTSYDFSIGVAVIRDNNRYLGICKGQDDDLLKLDIIESGADIREGDLVVSSGLSEVFPKGIVVGRVKQVWSDPVYNVKRATVNPAVEIQSVEGVLIQK